MERKIPHFSDSIFYSIEQISIYLEQHGKTFFPVVSDGIVSAEEFRTMDIIVCNPDICQRDLAKLVLKDRARVGRILDSLESKGLIKRFGDIKNNRLVKKMNLTEKGRILYEELTMKIEPFYNKFCSEFSPEQNKEMKCLLNSLKKALSEVVKITV